MAKKPRKKFDTGEGNLEMIKNSVTAIKHHADELTSELKKNPEIEAWVLAKVDRAAQNLSDVTHYLDGEMNKFAKGGKTPIVRTQFEEEEFEYAKGGTVAKEYKLVPMLPMGVKGMITPDYKSSQRFMGTQDEAVLKAKELANSNPNFVRVEIKRELKTKTNTVGIVDGQNKQYARGGNVTPKEKMIKELHKLQRELNSTRLSQYKEGDTSEEEMARQRERASKLARFNEILKELNEDDNKMADGGRILVGKFDEKQLRNGEDKKAIEKKMNETGYKYIDSKIIKKNGKPHMMEVYLYAKGGKVQLIFHGSSREIPMGEFESSSAAKKYVQESDWKRPYSIKKIGSKKMAKGGRLLTDYSKISSVEVDGIDTNDAPDFVDAYITYAEYDGEPMTDEQLEELNNDGDFVYSAVERHLYAKGGKIIGKQKKLDLNKNGKLDAEDFKMLRKKRKKL